MSENSIMKTPSRPTQDWRRFDAMSEAERNAAALADPDAQPLTQQRLAHMKRTPQVKVIRRALGLSQEEFAGALPHPAWHIARLGTGPQRARRRGARLPCRDSA